MLLVEEWLELVAEGWPIINNVATSVEERGWRFVPCCRWSVEERDIPHEVIGQMPMLGEPPSDYPFSVIELGNARVRNDRVIPGRTTVTTKHGEPNDVDMQFGRWIFCEDFLLNPPGPCFARRSGW